MSIAEKYQNIERTLDRELGKYPAVLHAERRMGIKKTNMVLILFGAVITLLLLNLFSGPVLALTATVYPAIMTMGAIEGDRDPQWLAYWLIVALLGLLEGATGGVLAALPFYAILKLVFYVWLFLPTTRGAMLVYERAVRPVALLVRDHPKIQEFRQEADKVASKITADVKTSTTAEAVKKEVAGMKKTVEAAKSK